MFGHVVVRSTTDCIPVLIAVAGVGDSPLYNTADYNHSNTDNDAGIMSENTQTNNKALE